MGLSENKLAFIERHDGRPGLGLVAERDGSIVGYAALAPARAAGEWAMEVVTADEELDPLVEEAVGGASAAGIERLRWWVYDDTLEDAPLRHGFEAERDLYRMSRPLPGPRPRIPSGVEIRPFRPGDDDRAWLEANNAAFADHHENGAMTPDDLARRMAMEWFDPEGLRIAWLDGEIGAYCWTKVHPSGEGEIYIIGTVPAHQGHGLGKAMVLEGMRHLHAVGCPRVFLYTDGDNQAAVRLYSGLGFDIDRIHRSFLRRLA